MIVGRMNEAGSESAGPSDLASDVPAILAEIRTLRSNLALVVRAVDLLAERRVGQAGQVESLAAERDALLERYRRLRALHEQTVLAKERLRGRLDAAVHQARVWRDRTDEAQAERQELAARRAALEEALEETRKREKALEQRLRRGGSDGAAPLRRRLLALEHRRKQLAARGAALRKALEESRRRVGELEGELTAARVAAGELRARAAELEAARSSARRRADEAPLEAERAARAASERLEGRVAELEVALAEARAEGRAAAEGRSKTEARAEVLEAELEEARRHAAAAPDPAALASAQEEAKGLRERLRALEGERAAESDAAGDALTRRQARERELERLLAAAERAAADARREAEGALAAQAERHGAALREARERAAQLEGERDAARGRAEELAARLRELEGEHEQAAAQVRALEQRAGHAQEGAARQEARRREQLGRALAERDALRAELERARADLEEARALAPLAGFRDARDVEEEDPGDELFDEAAVAEEDRTTAVPAELVDQLLDQLDEPPAGSHADPRARATLRHDAPARPQQRPGELTPQLNIEVSDGMLRAAIAWLDCDPLPSVPLAPGHTLTLGRSPTACDVVLPHPKVSRTQARLFVEGDGVIVEDLSKNGTYVNGERVATGHLALDDVISIGPYHLAIRAAPIATPTRGHRVPGGPSRSDLARFRALAEAADAERAAQEQPLWED